jgi:DNA-binding IclR family transcriptional regulator
VKFKGGVADVTKASNLFTGRIADKSKARRSARVLERYGYLKQVDGDIYKLTHSGLSLIRAFGRRNQMPPGDQD